MKKLKAAVIGVGHQGIEDHIPSLTDSSMADLVAICDSNPASLEKARRELGVEVPGFADCRELFAQTEMDFVIVALPHGEYGDVIEEASRHSVHILKEKPFARNLEEAMFIKRACDERGIKLMTTLQRRFNPIYTSFPQLVDQIGAPFFLDIRYTLFVDEPGAGWRGSRSLAGGGCIIDMGYHMIDLLIWYFGLPTSVHAECSTNAVCEEAYDAEDTAAIDFSFESGLHGVMILSRRYPPKTETFRVIGTRGIVELERGSIKRLNPRGEVAEHLKREHSWPAAASTQIDYFCRVIKGERENIGSPGLHLQHVAFIEACYLSAQGGCFVNPSTLLEARGV